MAVESGPDIITNGLAVSFDAANLRSFRGPPQTNVLSGINYGYSNQSSSTFRVANGEETVDIPILGRRSVKYVDIFNNHPSSGNCCLSLFNFGDVSTGVTGNTVYTYSIIYKTTTGYTHPNYMYRYEYNGGSYVTEAGVHNTSNRTHLGDGWYHAWGQFTTQASTNRLLCFLFHYEYNIDNRVYVAAVQITQGSYIGEPQHMLSMSQVRGTTNATGGGWVNLISNGNHGELVNGPTYTSGYTGGLVFDGNDDRITIGAFTYTPYCLDFWVYNNSTVPNNDGSIGGPSTYQTLWAPGSGPGISLGGWTGAATNETLHIWSTSGGGKLTYTRDSSIPPGIYNWVFNWNGSHYDIWVNGVKQNVYASSGGHAILQTYTSTAMYLATDNATYEFWGNIYVFKMYTSQLSDTQVLQNFNALRRRFGV